MLNRRAFVAASASSLAAFGAGAQGVTATRRSLRTMRANDPDLATYRRAVAAMKALPPSDPRNWLRFADVHRNFCPHGNWYFLPWHRAYLVALERICRDLTGNQNFALPYWNWTIDRQFPAAFAAGDRASNPLFHARPGAAQGLQLPDDMVGPAVISRVLNSPDFEAFGSTRPRGQNSAAAQWQRRLGAKTELEFNPHDGVHQSIGGNMGQVPLSARDPIFFLHHANVDRLWNAWNRRGNANSPEPIWRGFAFNREFPLPGGGLWRVGVGELGSPAALGYRYDDDDGPFAADVPLPLGDAVTEQLRAYRRLDTAALPHTGGGLRRIDLPGGAIYVAAAENSEPASRERPLAISVPLGRPLGEIVSMAAMQPRPARQRREQRYVWAIIRDVEPPLDAATRVRVFCNCVDLSPRTSVADRSYATSWSFFGGEHAGHDALAQAGAGEGVSVCIDLTPALTRMDARHYRGDRLTVQFLPSGDSSEAHVSHVRPRRVEIVVI